MKISSKILKYVNWDICFLCTFPANIRLDEDVFCLRLQKTSSRRLQDVLVKTNMFALALRLQKTSSRRLGQDQYIRLGHMFSRRLGHDQYIRLGHMFSRRLGQGQYIRLGHMSSRRFQDVFKTF